MDNKIQKFLFDIATAMSSIENYLGDKRDFNVKKSFAFILIILSSFCFSQKAMVEKLKINQTLTIQIQYHGDVFSDPRAFFTIQLTKLDSNQFELIYKRAGKELKKSYSFTQLTPLINLEKECMNAKNQRCLSYTELFFKRGWKTKSYRMNHQYGKTTLNELNIEY